MIILGAALIAIGSTEYFAGQAVSTLAIVIGTMLVLIALWRYRARNRQASSKRLMKQHHVTYSQIDEVLDRLEDLAQERDWDIDKRFEIARMACEHPTVAFDDLERRFDEGHRSAFDDLLQSAAEKPEKGVPM